MNYPTTWNKVKFEDIAKRKLKRITNVKQSGYEKFVGLEHLDSGELVVRRWGSTQNIFSSMQLFNNGDILFARRNTYLRRVSVALFDGVCSGDIIVIEPILKHVVEGFLPICMQFEEFENKVVAWSAGAFSKRIKWDQLSQFEIWLPSKEEQQKIVDVIWTIQRNLEKGIEFIRIVEKLKKGITQRLLTKGIGHKKFKTTEEGQIPEEWHKKKVFELIDDGCILEIQDGNHGEVHPKLSDFASDGIPFVTANCLSNNRLDFHKCKYLPNLWLKKLRVGFAKSNDVLLTHKGTIGLCAIVPRSIDTIILSPQVTYYRLTHSISRDFLYYYFQSDLFQNQLIKVGKQTTRYYIGITQQKLLSINLPPLQEQQKIASILSNVDDLLQELKGYNERMQSLKKVLIQEFLLGKIKVDTSITSNTNNS